MFLRFCFSSGERILAGVGMRFVSRCSGGGRLTGAALVVSAGCSGHTGFAGEEQPFQTGSSLKSTQRIRANSRYRKYGAPIRETTMPVGKAVSISVRPIASAASRMMLPIRSAIQL